MGTRNRSWFNRVAPHTPRTRCVEPTLWRMNVPGPWSSLEITRVTGHILPGVSGLVCKGIREERWWLPTHLFSTICGVVTRQMSGVYISHAQEGHRLREKTPTGPGETLRLQTMTIGATNWRNGVYCRREHLSLCNFGYIRTIYRMWRVLRATSVPVWWAQC